MSYDVFISYSSKDGPVAQSVCNAIERAGKRCWIAPRDITPGSDWAEAILAGIAECKLMVLVFSEHANLSPQIKREVERAVSRSMPILPFKIDPILPSGSFEFFIMNCHWLDASVPPVESHFERLQQSLTMLLDGSLDGGTTESRSTVSPRFESLALQHCDTYRSLFSQLGSFDGRGGFPRDSLAISRHTCDVDSDQNDHQTPNPLSPPTLFAEEQLIEQISARTRRRLWISGGGGIGKTEFSKLLALRLAEKFNAAPKNEIVPVRIELKSLDPAIPCNSADRLLNEHLAPDEIHWLERYLELGRVAFILDGMDELRLDRRSFNGAFVKLIKKLPECVFLITGRGESIDPELSNPLCFSRDSIHVLKPISLDQVREYVKSFFRFKRSEELAETMIDQLENDANLSDLLCNSPLLLSMASEVYLDDQKLTANPVDLLERGLSIIFARRRSRNLADGTELPGDGVCKTALACLAAHSFARQLSTRKSFLSFSRHDAVGWIRQNRE